MPFEVVHTQHGLVERCTQRAGHASTHQQRPCQARPAGVSHHVHICQALACFGHHGLGEREHPADMVAAGQLGHHAAIRLVHLDLAVQRMRQQGGHSHPTS